MTKIFVTDRNGEEHQIEAQEGSTLMEIIRDKGLDIEASCGGCCACATCHVYVDYNWKSKLKEKDDDEESMLDQAFDVKENSRLSCQIDFTKELDGIKLILAPE
tara:strand:+ start:288 stop:599 length:312 start_codon:yes stop_codon:yes gene_type:complete